MVVDGNLVDPNSGKVIFTAGKDPSEAKPIVVDGHLVDPSGKVLFSAPQKPDDEPLVAVMGPDGQPVMLPRSQAAGKRPADTREAGAASQAKDLRDAFEKQTADPREAVAAFGKIESELEILAPAISPACSAT